MLFESYVQELNTLEKQQTEVRHWESDRKLFRRVWQGWEGHLFRVCELCISNLGPESLIKDWLATPCCRDACGIMQVMLKRTPKRGDKKHQIAFARIKVRFFAYKHCRRIFSHHFLFWGGWTLLIRVMGILRSTNRTYEVIWSVDTFCTRITWAAGRAQFCEVIAGFAQKVPLVQRRWFGRHDPRNGGRNSSGGSSFFLFGILGGLLMCSSNIRFWKRTCMISQTFLMNLDSAKRGISV